jgi:hypothetical protein
MANEIEISLFKLLDEVSEILKASENVEDDDERVLIFHKIENNLETFLENFFLQLFNNGFELEIEGITEEALSEVESHFSDFKKTEIPQSVIDSFAEAIEILIDIETAVYLDPPRHGDLYEAYLTFLPELFESYRKDEAVLRNRIENYGAINTRMEGILAVIGELKQQTLLS